MTSSNIGIGVVVVLAVLASTCHPAAPPSSEVGPIDELIERLGAEEYDTREEAEQGLRLREEAIPQLIKAGKHSDLEVRRRARRILGYLVSRKQDRMLKRAGTLMAAGDVDQAVELLVRWGSETRTEGLAETCDLARRLVRARTSIAPKGGRENDLLTRLTDFSRFQSGGNGSLTWSRDPLTFSGRLPGGVVRAPAVSFAKHACRSIVIATGEVRGEGKGIDGGGGGGCLVLANGAVHLRGIMASSVIVCDGPVTIESQLSSSVIIARGCVSGAGSVPASVVISAGEVQTKRLASVVKENDTFPLELVRFFDPKRVGIEVVNAKGGVKVKTAERAKPFATAGVKAGDVITAINGEKVADPEEFRRLLRPHAAEQGTFTLSLLRDGKPLEARVSLAP